MAAAIPHLDVEVQISSLEVHEVRWFFCEDEPAHAQAANTHAPASNSSGTSASGSAPSTTPAASSSTAKWQPFCSHDSRAIEEAYRKTLPSWTTDPSTLHTEEPHLQPTTDTLVPVRGGLYDVNVQKRIATSPFWKAPPQRVQRCTWFMAETSAQAGFCDPCDEFICTQVESAHVSAVWAAQQRKETKKLEAEEAQLSTSPQGAAPIAQKAKSSKKEFLYHLSISNHKQFVIWYDMNTVHLCTESTMSNLSQMVGRKLGHRIVRGYGAARAGILDPTGKMGEQHCRCGEVRHLIMVSHGIGQKISQTVAARAHTAIHEQTKKLRGIAEELAAEGIAGDELKKGNRRVEFLPIEWRTSLPLDETTVGNITPKGADFLRRALNHTIVDVLYFTSPKYCQDIVDSMTNALNKQYKEFIARHPYFEAKGGKVSIIAHSLGGVITMEILSSQDSLPTEAQAREERQLQMLRDEVARLERKLAQKHAADLLAQQELERVDSSSDQGSNKSEGRTTPQHHEHMHRADSAATIKPNGVICDKLLFKVDTLFAIGSPVSLFLSLRGASANVSNPLHGKHLLPKGVRVYNVYHALDPVAYRLEPLILDYEGDEMPAPVAIPKYVNDKAKGISFSSMTKAATGLISSLRRSSLLTPSKKKPPAKQPKVTYFSGSEEEDETIDVEEEVLKQMVDSEQPEEEDDVAKAAVPVFESPEKTRLADGERIDFTLASRYVDASLVYQYAQVPRAHLRYWSDKDFIVFMLQRLCIN